MTEPQPLAPETLAVTAGRPDKAGESLNPPLVAASNFRIDPLAPGGREYSRNEGSSQWEALEDAVAALEGGSCVSFASGMGAASAILDLLPAGATVALPSDCYQGVTAIAAQRQQTQGWTLNAIETDDHDGWLGAIAAKPDLVWVESPSNPMMKVADVPALCAAAAASKIPLVVDNTFATPLLQNPLRHGASYSLHSATKFIGGHSDLLAGLVACADEPTATALRLRRTLGGATPGTLEAFLALRGLRTLPVRLERSQNTATELANRLAEHPAIANVRYPGLKSDPGYELASRIMSGPGAVLSFETTGSADELDRVLASLRVATVATSLGGVETTLERRSRLVGQEAVPPTLVRMSVGCEHVEDLWTDLRTALD